MTPWHFVGLGEHADVAVVLVTYNSSSHILDLIGDLRRDTQDLALRVIVIDNDSADGTVEIASTMDDVIVVEAGGNTGYAGGINRAAPYLGSCSAVLILNPDLRVRRGAIRSMWTALSLPSVGAVVPLNVRDKADTLDFTLRREPSIMRALGDAFVGGLRFSRRPAWSGETVLGRATYQRPQAVDWAAGSALLVRANVASQVGDWDERYFLYSEETDYFRRIREEGYLVWFEPNAIVEHSGAGSGTSLALSTLLVVNRVRYVEHWHSHPYTAVFRMVVAASELMRAGNRTHRHSALVALNRRKWNDLPKATTAREATSP